MRPQPAAYILDSFAILAYLEDELKNKSGRSVKIEDKLYSY